MSKCKYKGKDGICDRDCEFTFRGFCHDGPCGDYEPQTNADRIRAMTDEELSAFLGSIVHDYGQGTAEIEGAGYVIDDWLTWLREEVPE